MGDLREVKLQSELADVDLGLMSLGEAGSGSDLVGMSSAVIKLREMDLAGTESAAAAAAVDWRDVDSAKPNSWVAEYSVGM